MKIFLEHFCFVRIHIIGIIILLQSSSGCQWNILSTTTTILFVGEMEYIISMVQFHNSRVKGQGLKSRKTLDTTRNVKTTRFWRSEENRGVKTPSTPNTIYATNLGLHSNYIVFKNQTSEYNISKNFNKELAMFTMFIVTQLKFARLSYNHYLYLQYS